MKQFDINWTLVQSGIPCRTGFSTFAAQNERDARELFEEEFSKYESVACKYQVVSVVERYY